MQVEIKAESIYSNRSNLPVLTYSHTVNVTTPLVLILSKDGPAELDKMLSREVSNGMMHLAQKFLAIANPPQEVRFIVDFGEGVYAQRYVSPGSSGDFVKFVGLVGEDVVKTLVEALGPSRTLLRQYNEYAGKDPATGLDTYNRKVYVVKDVDAAAAFFGALPNVSLTSLPVFTAPVQAPAPAPPACECGSEKVGAPGHSYWCPKYRT